MKYWGRLVRGEEVEYRMRHYEVLFIIKPELDEERVNEVVERFTSLIENEQGEVIKVDNWGKRKLAYMIDNKWREGFYALVEFKGAPETAQEINRVMGLSDDIIRQLITCIEE